MTGFVQVIEFKTSRIDEVRKLATDLRRQHGSGTVLRGVVTEDRDRPGYYLNIVEFESYESAMRNSERVEVTEFAGRMAALCDEPPRFYNLNVLEDWRGEASHTAKAALAGTATAVSGAAEKARHLLHEGRDQLAKRRHARTNGGSGTTA